MYRTRWLSLLGTGAVATLFAAIGSADERPNVLWLTSEDHGPHMGCYGDAFATTPHIDALAARGTVYLHCWSCAPVCAPARTTLISGLYPPSTGSEHMRSMLPYPAGKKMYPQFLREAGYYCTNNVKTDYNLKEPGRVWDESSNKAHWRKRASGQPFFAVFNSVKSHESQMRKRPHTPIHDPAKVRVPTYHPDTPEVRRDWAQYYDVVSEVDADAGDRLRELDEDGLTDDTIVFYYADHGSGMPRNKRWPCNSGLQAPLVIYIPEKFQALTSPDYRPGGKSERLVSFVDFAPTLLSLVGIEPPAWMQGHAFLGKYRTEPQPFAFAFRGRMDERYDMARSVTDGRYVYVRNYLPHKPWAQHISYMFETPTTQVWKRLHDAGQLTLEQDSVWNPKAPEELYDLQTDPDEVHNLATSLEHREVLARVRAAQQAWALEIRDVGFLPEGEIHERSTGGSPYDMARIPGKVPLERIFATADSATLLQPDAVPQLRQAMHDEDSAVRYWATLGMFMRGSAGVAAAQDELRSALQDDSPYVRIAAAEALVQYGDERAAQAGLQTLVELGPWDAKGVFVSVAALNALDALGPKAQPALEGIAKFPHEGPTPHPRYAEYVPRLLAHLMGEK